MLGFLKSLTHRIFCGNNICICGYRHNWISFCKINLPTVSFSGFYTDKEILTRLLPLVPSQESTGIRKDSCYILPGSFSGILRNFFGSLADKSGAKFKSPPPWEDGKVFEKWDEEIKFWQLVTDLQKTQQAPALALSLECRKRERALCN